MKPQMLVGAILTGMGIVALTVSGMHFTRNVQLPSDSPTKITVKRETVISIPPIVGGVAVAGGLLLMVLAARK
jgi:hypothetical protein